MGGGNGTGANKNSKHNLRKPVLLSIDQPTGQAMATQSLPDQLELFMQRWKGQKVDSHVTFNNNSGYIVLNKVVVPKETRGQGLGTKFMKELVALADSQGKSLALTPDTSFGATSVGRLEKFYRQFGFVPNKGRNKDFTTKETMLRPYKKAKIDVDQPTGQAMASEKDTKQETLTKLQSFKPKIAELAQKIVDEWQPDEEGIDEQFGGGGACDEIAKEIGTLLSNNGFEIVDGGQDGDDHAYLYAHNGKHAFVVDIPPGVYEMGAGYSWKKIPDAQITPDDVVIEEVNIKDILGDELDVDQPVGQGMAVQDGRKLSLAKGIHSIEDNDVTIKYSIHEDDPKEIELSSIRTKTSELKKGKARSALEAFLQQTDQQGVDVTLLASPLNKTTKLNKLVEFYQKAGFELTGKTNMAGEPYMRRKAGVGRTAGVDVSHESADEYGQHFETGKPVEFPFVRNTESSKQFGNFGNIYQQDIEPAGRYMLHDFEPTREPLPNWQKGKIKFNNPIVIRANAKTDGAKFDEHSWKATLSKMFGGKTGKALTKAIQDAGHDGIVTLNGKNETGEIVDLTKNKI